MRLARSVRTRGSVGLCVRLSVSCSQDSPRPQPTPCSVWLSVRATGRSVSWKTSPSTLTQSHFLPARTRPAAGEHRRPQRGPAALTHPAGSSRTVPGRALQDTGRSLCGGGCRGLSGPWAPDTGGPVVGVGGAVRLEGRLEPGVSLWSGPQPTHKSHPPVAARLPLLGGHTAARPLPGALAPSGTGSQKFCYKFPRLTLRQCVLRECLLVWNFSLSFFEVILINRFCVFLSQIYLLFYFLLTSDEEEGDQDSSAFGVRSLADSRSGQSLDTEPDCPAVRAGARDPQREPR